MKYWKVGSAGHELVYYSYAPTRDIALRHLDIVLGGHNPAKLIIQEVCLGQIPEDTGVFGAPDAQE